MRGGQGDEVRGRGTSSDRSSTTQGRCRGCVAQDLVTMEIRALPADAVIVASGGCGLFFGRSTNSMACNAQRP